MVVKTRASLAASYLPMLLLMLRSALFAFVGLAFFGWWVVADPSFEESASQSEWSSVLAFSGVILLLAFAVPTLA